MDKEKFNAILEYFKENNIELKPEVQNSIEDIFLENDNIDGVECYHLEDIDQFEKDLKIENKLVASITGQNSGSVTDVFTYYGGAQISLSESYVLVDENNNVLREISSLNNENNSLIEDPSDFTIILLDKYEWDTSINKSEKSLKIYIFCPYASDEEVVDKYEKAYDTLLKEEGQNESEL